MSQKPLHYSNGGAKRNKNGKKDEIIPTDCIGYAELRIDEMISWLFKSGGKMGSCK